MEPNVKLPVSVDFGNLASIGMEAALAQQRFFGFKITNSSLQAQKVILSPSYAPTSAARVIRTGAIPYAGGATDLTCQSNGEKPVETFLEWIKHHPTRVLLIEISSNNVSQTQTSMNLINKVIWGDDTPQVINLSSYKNPANLDDKLLRIQRELQLDIDTELSIIIPAAPEGSSVETSITFYCGAVWNDAEGLYRSVMNAKNNPQVAAVARGLQLGGR